LIAENSTLNLVIKELRNPLDFEAGEGGNYFDD